MARSESVNEQIYSAIFPEIGIEVLTVNKERTDACRKVCEITEIDRSHYTVVKMASLSMLSETRSGNKR